MFDDLLPALQRLDQLLEQALAAAQATYAPEAKPEADRDFHIGWDNARRQPLDIHPCELLQVDGTKLEEFYAELVGNIPRMAWLQNTFDLSAFDLCAILIALAPEVDLQYERAYSYLQDDIACKRPSVDLVLNLLCPSIAAKVIQRARFNPDAPLIRHGLLHLLVQHHQEQPPLLAHSLRLDDRVICWLLAQGGLDPSLATFCQIARPTVSLEALPLSAEIRQALRSLTVQAQEAHRPLHFYFHGPHGVGKQPTAEAIASNLDMLLLVADLAQIPFAKADLALLLKILFREAQFCDAVLFIRGIETLFSNEFANAYQRLLTILAEDSGIVILAGLQARSFNTTDANANILPVNFPMPDFARRRDCWQMRLVESNIHLHATDLDALADRFRLTPSQISHTVTLACNEMRWQAAQDLHKPPLKPSDRQILEHLFASARAQSDRGSIALAHKIEPRYTWEDIVLPSEHLAQLREICNQVKYRHIVYGDWGFERKLSLGKGLNVLFSGTPGTGKTMAAEAIANNLHLDLYKIDLSQIVSKYIGETEKNLDRIFTAAENASAILLFDEADALFGKRSEVKDAHDRYANIEVAYLLQKMEEYEGITLLTTNFHQNLDEAFTRRIRFIVEFPFPEEEHRLKIWQGIWPQETPLNVDIDLKLMARQFKLAGGNIRNIALAAAFLAAEDGQSVSMKHLLHATKREYRKMGKLVNEEDFLNVEL